MTRMLGIAGAVLLAAMAGTAAAREDTASDPLLEKHGDGVRLTENAISGQELLEADLVDVTVPVGTVSDVILNDVGAIVFLKYRTSRFRDMDQEGYLPVDELTLVPSPGFGVDVDLSQIDALSMREQMRLNEREQESQVLSSILRSHVLVDGNAYEIRDVAFDSTGKARYFLLTRSGGGFLQPGDAFAVPFENARYVDGAWRTGLSADDLMIIVIFT